MTLTLPKSSNLKEVSYDEKARTMTVTFMGDSVYNYYDIPPELIESFQKCESAGKFFTENVKKKPFKWERIS